MAKIHDVAKKYRFKLEQQPKGSVSIVFTPKKSPHRPTTSVRRAPSGDTAVAHPGSRHCLCPAQAFSDHRDGPGDSGESPQTGAQTGAHGGGRCGLAGETVCFGAVSKTVIRR